MGQFHTKTYKLNFLRRVKTFKGSLFLHQGPQQVFMDGLLTLTVTETLTLILPGNGKITLPGLRTFGLLRSQNWRGACDVLQCTILPHGKFTYSDKLRYENSTNRTQAEI